MKWKIIPIVIASFILVQCKSPNKTALKEAENIAKGLTHGGGEGKPTKLPGETTRIIIGKITQTEKGHPAAPQMPKEFPTETLNFETRVNKLTESIIQESRDVFTSEDESELRAFSKSVLCKEFDAEIKNELMTDSDYAGLVAQTLLPPNKQKELSDKIDKITELGKSISAGDPDGSAAIQAYCVIS
jgi:hypothetical protein